ncbi:MAG: hypothetical protein ACI9TV_000755 [Sulfurimonas sp.]|jgi:hypothetical protein|uniref:hypothetical protein n=1 Tax=Sulfurimonas sp. TaxID=2022749 RepID=UPI0039E313FB
MKLRVLISILFIIATTFTAVHEIEHIHGEHDSSTCEVCIVDNHLVSADIIDIVSYEIYVSFDIITLKNQIQNPHLKKTTNQATAPPVIS